MDSTVVVNTDKAEVLNAFHTVVLPGKKSQVLKINEKVRSRGSGVSRDGMHPEALREPANVIVNPQLTIFERSQ